MNTILLRLQMIQTRKLVLEIRKLRSLKVKKEGDNSVEVQGIKAVMEDNKITPVEGGEAEHQIINPKMRKI